MNPDPDLGHPPPADDPAPPMRVNAVLVTVKEAGEMLGVGRTTAYELISNGDLEVVHIGRCARVPVESVIELVESLRRRDAS